MATALAHAAAAIAAGEAALSHGQVGTRPTPPRLGFLVKQPSRWAAISLPPGPRRPAPAAAAAKEAVAEEEEPAWVELEPIASEKQLDRALAEAQQLDLPIVLLWMASWCRKCIYLKPKLEKLAAEYHPRIRFYCVDVNAVPQKLVNRAGVTAICTSLLKYASFLLWWEPETSPLLAQETLLSVAGLMQLASKCLLALSFSFGIGVQYQKMPSIQLWSESQKQAEVIGGHKSWLVIDDVRKMIEREE